MRDTAPKRKMPRVLPPLTRGVRLWNMRSTGPKKPARHLHPLLGVTAAAAFLCAAIGYAEDTLTLKEEAYVKGPKVYLADIAKISGENAASLASIEVTPAALPGASKRLNAAYVEARIRKAGLDPGAIEINGAHSIQATTLHLEISPQMIADSLRQHIEVEMPWDPANTDIDVPLPITGLRVPDGEVLFSWRPNPQFNFLGTGAFRGAIEVDGQVQKTLLCKATVETYASVVIAKNEISRGRLVSQNDLELRTFPLSTAPGGAITNMGEVTGLVARKTIFPGRVLTTHDVTPRKVIKRNQIVPVDMRAGTLHIQTRARALMDACVGDAILCVNINSKEQFQGTVRADGVVAVR